MFRLIAFSTLLLTFLSACMKGQHADLIIHNAVIHTMDENGTIYEAMAIRDGKIIELGPERQILNKYSSDESIDAGNKDVYPGLTDSHVHLILAAKQRMGLDLAESKSFAQLMMNLEIYQERNHKKIIVGQGWNEGYWRDSSFPTNERLNELFPTTPVCLFRYDGHTALVNDAMLKLAGITAETVIPDGEVMKVDGKLTGIVTDGAMELVKLKLPSYSLNELKEKVIEIQNEFLMYGITNVHDAGLEADELKMYQQLVKSGQFKLNMYGMLLPTKENIQFAKENGIYTYKNLNVRSFKVFIDGALGSRGAFLKAPYSDDAKTSGHTTITKEKLDEMVHLCSMIGYQLNAHAIGDSAVRMVLDAYKGEAKINPDHRWRIEHAQIIDLKDLPLFLEYGVLPSVQPTHAVSDYRFAEQRIGAARMKGAYAYKTLLNTTGILLLGTDYPIEDMDPFKTIYAACVRKNDRELPEGGFMTSEAISLEDCLKGMTIWPALGSFQENHLGQLVKGMDATFAIFERNISIPPTFFKNFSIYTYINGKKVYAAE